MPFFKVITDYVLSFFQTPYVVVNAKLDDQHSDIDVVVHDSHAMTILGNVSTPTYSELSHKNYHPCQKNQPQYHTAFNTVGSDAHKAQLARAFERDQLDLNTQNAILERIRAVHWQLHNDISLSDKRPHIHFQHYHANLDDPEALKCVIKQFPFTEEQQTNLYNKLVKAQQERLTLIHHEQYEKASSLAGYGLIAFLSAFSSSYIKQRTRNKGQQENFSDVLIDILRTIAFNLFVMNPSAAVSSSLITKLLNYFLKLAHSPAYVIRHQNILSTLLSLSLSEDYLATAIDLSSLVFVTSTANYFGEKLGVKYANSDKSTNEPATNIYRNYSDDDDEIEVDEKPPEISRSSISILKV
ncbi:MAG: hypothetical protein KIT27_04045 [Legionellales bacterium]|nr:hypothetical protein [Legionellales bacterium]